MQVFLGFCTLRQSFSGRMCAFFQSIFARLCLLWSTHRDRSDEIPLLKCQSYVIWISYSSLVMSRPLFTHQSVQTLPSHSYSIPQQKSASFLLNSFVLPFCTWGLPEWWSTEIFVLEPEALAAYTIKVFWKSLLSFYFCVSCLFPYYWDHCLQALLTLVLSPHHHIRYSSLTFSWKFLYWLPVLF